MVTAPPNSSIAPALRAGDSLRALSVPTRAFLAVFFVLFNVFAFARAVPMNSSLEENTAQARGDYDRDVYRVFDLATAAASQPFSEVRNHAIYFDRNPGLFLFLTELAVRMGVSTPYPIQVFCILLWNIGLWFCFLWLRRVFASEVAAAVGIAYLLTTPALLFFSSSIHHEPYCFCFFHITMYCFVRFLEGDTETSASEATRKRSQKRWLALTCLAYLLVCENYWFYYVSTYLMLLALQVRYGKFSLRVSALLAAVPVFALVTVVLQVAYARGLADGLFRMADILAARSGDFRIQGSQWHPHQKFVGAKQIHNYPMTVMTRLGATMGYPAWVLFGLLFLTLALAGREGLHRNRWLALVVAAGLSWYVLMVQHTVMHHFVGMYSHFLWTVLAAALASELQRRYKPEWPRWGFALIAVPIALVGLSRNYVPYLTRYVRNIAAGEVVDAGAKVSKSKGKAKSKGKGKSKDKSKHAAPKSDEADEPDPVDPADPG